MLETLPKKTGIGLEEFCLFSQINTSLWCTGQCPVPRLARRRTRRSRKFAEYAAAKIHRTVRWANGARGQRSSARSTGDTWLSQRSDGHTRLSGAPTRPKTQQSALPEKEGDHAPDRNFSCPVVHRTVRCTTRQKARIAFLLDLQ